MYQQYLVTNVQYIMVTNLYGYAPYTNNSRLNSNSQYSYVPTAPKDVITVSHIDKVDASFNSNTLNSSLYAGISNAHSSSDPLFSTHLCQLDRVGLGMLPVFILYFHVVFLPALEIDIFLLKFLMYLLNFLLT